MRNNVPIKACAGHYINTEKELSPDTLHSMWESFQKKSLRYGWRSQRSWSGFHLGGGWVVRPRQGQAAGAKDREAKRTLERFRQWHPSSSV